MAYYRRAMLRSARGELDGAKEDLEKCLEIDPRHIEAGVELATILMAMLDLETVRESNDVMS